MIMKRENSFLWMFLLITAICILAFLAVQTAHAAPQLEAARGSTIILQSDGTPLAGDTPAPVSSLTDTLLSDVEVFLGTYGGVVGVAASFLVGILGGIPALANVPKRILNLVVSGVLVGALLLATNFGYGTQVQAGIDALPVVGKALLALLVAFGFSTGVHEAANVYSVPVWGAKRTPRT